MEGVIARVDGAGPHATARVLMMRERILERVGARLEILARRHAVRHRRDRCALPDLFLA